ncbi:DUF523 domain-containing protein, partial [Rhodobacterales bacterium HKCCSP123]|nr:DUF523 domain-containing protein [Rhodobacterales bacterium HKCCSP123]
MCCRKGPAVQRILVSACLIGRPVRYDGRAKDPGTDLLARWQAEGRLVPLCPEMAGGTGLDRIAQHVARGAGGKGL